MNEKTFDALFSAAVEGFKGTTTPPTPGQIQKYLTTLKGSKAKITYNDARRMQRRLVKTLSETKAEKALVRGGYLAPEDDEPVQTTRQQVRESSAGQLRHSASYGVF